MNALSPFQMQLVRVVGWDRNWNKHGAPNNVISGPTVTATMTRDPQSQRLAGIQKEKL